MGKPRMNFLLVDKKKAQRSEHGCTPRKNCVSSRDTCQGGKPLKRQGWIETAGNEHKGQKCGSVAGQIVQWGPRQPWSGRTEDTALNWNGGRSALYVGVGHSLKRSMPLSLC